MGIVWIIIIGFVAGLIARGILPGKDTMSWLQTLILGVVGAFIGKTINVLITSKEFGDSDAGGLFWAIGGSIVALLVYRQIKARGIA